MRTRAPAMLITAAALTAGCATDPESWSGALARGAAYSAAEASESASETRAQPAESARYDAAVGLWQCRSADGRVRYSRSGCARPGDGAR